MDPPGRTCSIYTKSDNTNVSRMKKYFYYTRGNSKTSNMANMLLKFSYEKSYLARKGERSMGGRDEVNTPGFAKKNIHLIEEL